MRYFLLLLLFFPIIASGQVVVEYKVHIEEEVSPEQKAALPVKIYIATNGERVIVRGIWDTPRNSYQLYVPDDNALYHCDLDGTMAVKYDFQPPGEVLLSMAPQKIIAGMYCKEAFVIEDRDTFAIYYTDAFGIQFCQIARIPGFAMRYSKRLQGVKVTYEALKYYFEAAPEEMFSLEGRKLVEPEQLSGGRQWALQIGRKAPKVTGKCLDGSRFGPKNYAGKTLVMDINTFASSSHALLYWQELNWFNALARDYAGAADVVFLSVFREDALFLSRIIPPNTLAYPVLPDGMFYVDAYRLEVLPATIVIHPNGRVAEFVLGHNPDSEARLKRAIDLAKSGGLKPEGID